MAFQEMSLVPTLTVAQNVFLTREIKSGGLIDDKAAIAETRRLFAAMGVAIDPTRKVADIPAGHKQLTEIVKATSQPCKVLVLDEPTTALSADEVDRLFDYVRRLRAQGVAIVYVSHRMDEIFRIADRATILRDGKHVITAPMSEFTLESHDRPHHRPPLARLLRRDARDRGDRRGAAGGARSVGRTEAARRQPHAAPRRGRGRRGPARQRALVAGPGALRHPADRRRARSASRASRSPSASRATPSTPGIALVPEDRGAAGLRGLPLGRGNIGLPNLDRLSKRQLGRSRQGRRARRAFDQAPAHQDGFAQGAVRTLSGGNAQKVVIAKWLATEPDVLILDEPTAGIDIGSKSEIVTLIRDLAKSGKAILVLSSELQELLAACDRILSCRTAASCATSPATSSTIPTQPRLDRRASSTPRASSTKPCRKPGEALVR